MPSKRTQDERAVSKGSNGGKLGKNPAEKPVSLHPLKFEEAVRGLLRVRPRTGKDRQAQEENWGGGQE